MKKKQKKSDDRSRPIVDAKGKIDWAPVVKIAKVTLDWAHRLAAELSRPEERAAIERVFSSLPALLGGGNVDVSLEDTLHVFHVIGRGIERDQKIPSGTFDLIATMFALAFGPLRPVRARAPIAPVLFPLRAPISGRSAVLHIHR